jgi:hypothetical protein
MSQPSFNWFPELLLSSLFFQYLQRLVNRFHMCAKRKHRQPNDGFSVTTDQDHLIQSEELLYLDQSTGQ